MAYAKASERERENKERVRRSRKGEEEVETRGDGSVIKVIQIADYASLFNERRVSRIFTARNGSWRLAGSKGG